MAGDPQSKVSVNRDEFQDFSENVRWIKFTVKYLKNYSKDNERQVKFDLVNLYKLN